MKEGKWKPKSWFGMGLFTKVNLFIAGLVFATLAVLCILLTYSMIYPDVQKDKVLNEEASAQLAAVISNKYSAVFNQSKLVHTQDHVATRIDAFNRSGETFFSLDDIRFLNSYLTAVHYADPDILDVVIIPLQSADAFHDSSDAARRVKTSFEYLSLNVVQTVLASERNIIVAYSSQQEYMSPSDTEVMTFAVKIFNPNSGLFTEPIGIMLINYPLSLFSDAYRKLGDLSGGSVYVVNHENEIVFSTEHSLLGQPYDVKLQDNAEVQAYGISTSGMRLVSIMPEGVIQSTIGKMLQKLVTILLPAMLFIIMVIFVCNRQYRRRIEGLSMAIQNYASGVTEKPIPIHHKDELAMLSRQFNEMCERLDRQIKLHYQAEMGRKTAELNALQAQINPHFLYNTIESIRMRAVEEGSLDVSDMLMQLGQMFHWMIQLDKRIVYLEDEIEYNEAYLRLQKLRYEDSFESRITVPDDALYLGVPKFTLQPIIENALLHGLKENGISGLIAVDVHIEQQMLVLRVCDNGSGMDEAMLHQLQQHITGEESRPEFGIGMKNVHSRIQMLFGGDYGVIVQSAPNNGTTVTITLPALAKKEMEKKVEQENMRSCIL